MGKMFGALVAAGLLGLGLIATQPAVAAAPTTGFTGATPSSVAGCPYLVWRLVNSANGAIHGIVYYSDLSGLSSVAGTMESDGKFTLTLTKSGIGSGPVGTVTGTRSADGHIVATLVGEGCANNSVNIAPASNMNDMKAFSGR